MLMMQTIVMCVMPIMIALLVPCIVFGAVLFGGWTVAKPFFFSVRCQGVALFEFPHVLPIWLAYLKKFLERYQGNTRPCLALCSSSDFVLC